MQLTTAQIQHIEKYLTKKNIVYIDVRLEVLDHIISDIEVLIEAKNLDFENAFNVVTKKWNAHFVDTSSFIFGVMYSGPKMVIEKAKRIFKKYFFLFFPIYFLPLIIFNLIAIKIPETFHFYCNYTLNITLFLCILLQAYILFFNLKSKTKTVYSFILKTQSLGIIMFFIVFFDQAYINDLGELNASILALVTSLYYATFCIYTFYKKHKEIVLKLQ